MSSHCTAFLFLSYPRIRYLPSFPTRRSSDLCRAERSGAAIDRRWGGSSRRSRARRRSDDARDRSEEHTSELQSRGHLVCRLLLEKKKVFLESSSRSHCGVVFVALSLCTLSRF